MREDWYRPDAVSRQVSRNWLRKVLKGRNPERPVRIYRGFKRTKTYTGKGANETGRWEGKSLN